MTENKAPAARPYILGVSEDRERYLAGCFYAAEKIEPGYYAYDQCGLGVVFIRLVMADEPIRRINQSQTRLFDVVRGFWESGDRYRAMQVPHRSGILLHGKPGTGKTVVLRKAIQETIESGGYALELGELDELRPAIKALRQHAPGCPVLVVKDDLDSWIQSSRNNEVELTHFMDGVDGVMDGVLFVATTNHIQRFPDRLTRPGRFDYVVEIDAPTEEERRQFLSELWKVPFDHPAVIDLAKRTKGHVTSSLRAIGIQVYVAGIERTKLGGPQIPPPIERGEPEDHVKTQKAKEFIAAFNK